MDVETIVKDRYSAGAKEKQQSLCCPVDYDADLLKHLPAEILEKDYGCGDPSRYVRPGDTVLDLGSGGGKICYMAAQLVGPSGQVIGVDMNDDMLALARKYQTDMQAQFGGKPVRFLKGYIQDLAVDVESLDQYLAEHPIKNADDLRHMQHWQAGQVRDNPLIADNSIDLVISNCVLNLVDDAHKQQLIAEIFRVLKPGGRVAISDIVSDEPIPPSLKEDAELWSGCISGAFHEAEFSQAFAEQGFHAVCYDKWDLQPWQIVEGIEFRSVTLTAVKGESVPALDKGHAVIYRGPFASVTDDAGNVYYRGERMAVSDRSFRLLTGGHYQDDFIAFQAPGDAVATDWDLPAGTRRAAGKTKTAAQPAKEASPSCCC